MKLWQKVAIGLVLGALFGVFFPDYAIYFKPAGDIFLRFIKMVIAPLIFFVLVSGITSMEDPTALARIGLKSTIIYMITTVFAIIFGIGVASVLEPGIGTQLDLSKVGSVTKIAEEFNLGSFFVNIVPEHVVAAFSAGNYLQIVFFSIFAGIAINKMGKEAESLKNFFHIISKMMLKMICMVMELAPYGAFALTSWVVGVQGVEILFTLSKLVFAVLFAMALQHVIFGLMILIFCRISPMPFYRKSLTYQLVALSTSSSKATLPTTMEVCRDDMGMSEASTSFILPLGAAINMDGMAIYLGLTAIFFAQIFGIDLQFHDYCILTLTSTLGSIGAAGIPGGSLVMMPMVLSSVGIPLEGIGVLVGVDRILDMVRTAINITGDVTVTLIVDHNEGTMDMAKYHSA
jgi:Na+/H+-dicarboxylate symporter